MMEKLNMGKEAKIGVGVVLGLLVILGGVVGVRVSSLGGDGESDAAIQDAEATATDAPVSVQPGVAVAANPLPKPSTPASRPLSEKPPTPTKPTLVTPEYPEPPASGAAQWRQLAIQDASAGAAGVSEAGSGLAYVPPSRPSPYDPPGRYGVASAPPPP
ncbi:MAG: hypothetical protein U1E05_24970, partial [Patescibacteria group bacterium]|nr:hypothetical protein [Patescibacteria group bacterium]